MKFRKPLVDEFNSLFNIISTEGKVQVTRSNKDHGSVIEKWENARQIYLRGGATKEENFLVSGRLAHPSPIVRSNQIYNAMYTLVRTRDDIKEYLKNLEVNQGKSTYHGAINPTHIQDALGAIEYARGAKVASSHYSNSGIEQVAVDQLGAEQQVAAGNPLRQINFENEAIRNVALRLLGQPALYTEAEQKYSTSHIAEISEAETKDENIQGFYSRVLRECTHILGLADQPVGTGCFPVDPTGKQDDEGEELVRVPTGGTEPDEEPDDEGEDEAEGEQESEGDESEDEGDEESDGEDEQDEDQGEEQKAPDKSPVDEILDELLDKVQESTPDVGVGDEEPTDLTPADVEDQSERCQEEIERVFNNQYEVSESTSVRWVDNPYNLDDIAAPEDDGSSSRSFRGIPTHETWRLNQGKVNVFNSQMETDPSKLLVLVDCSGSTHDSWYQDKRNRRGFRSTQQVMWTLAGTLLKTSPNSVAYGFCGSQLNIDIYPGLKSGTYPKGEWYRGEGNVGGGGTPTSQALHWASLKSGGSDDVIVLITDGMPGISAPTMVRRLADGGATVAVIVVPNAHGNLVGAGYTARNFGSEISGVYDPRSPESEDSIQQLMANLIV
jgi:hypothetical protein